MTSSDDIDQDMENLRSYALNGTWHKVTEMYEKQRELRTAKITATGDTVLHMAVSSGREDDVDKMVGKVCGERINRQVKMSPSLPSVDENGDEKKDVLGAKNDKGNTPLHLAASIGNVKLCKKIGGVDPSLITIRNSTGETPLFMAALHGHKKAFICLHYLYMDSSQGSSTHDALYKRDDNDTILHCAVAGGHIELAIDIVLLYKDHLEEMMMRNNNGLSPLHILAVTPSAFESTDLPSRSYFAQLCYHCLFRVKKKQRATKRDKCEQPKRLDPDYICSDSIMDACTDCTTHIYDGGSSWIAKIRDPISDWLFYLAIILTFPFFVLDIIFESAGKWFNGIRKMKKKHKWSLQILEELLQLDSSEHLFEKPYEEESGAGHKIVDTPLMIAAKNGVTEMVEQILKCFPSTLEFVNEEGKNIVLLAAEKRQTKVYQILCENEKVDKSVFSQVDKDGNTALHLAAKLEVNLNWKTTTMVEEFKWFQFVKSSVPSELWEKYNKDGKTAEDIFRDSYKEYMTSDRQWLNQTSQTCSVASTLVASMTFSNIVSENFDPQKNRSSIVALSLSLTSTISFLSILAFRSQSLNFWRYVPFMLQIAILTMFGSIVALWISLMFHGKALTWYAILGLPIAILTIVSLPIFIGPTLMSLFTTVPPPNCNTTSAIQYRRPQIKDNSGTDIDGNQEPTTNLTFRANNSFKDIGRPTTRLRIQRMNTL